MSCLAAKAVNHRSAEWSATWGRAKWECSTARQDRQNASPFPIGPMVFPAQRSWWELGPNVCSKFARRAVSERAATRSPPAAPAAARAVARLKQKRASGRVRKPSAVEKVVSANGMSATIPHRLALNRATRNCQSGGRSASPAFASKSSINWALETAGCRRRMAIRAMAVWAFA